MNSSIHQGNGDELKIFKLVLAAVLLSALATVANPGAASAAVGCSLSKKANASGTITYTYCDSRPSAGKWGSHVRVVNRHGADVKLDSELTLRIDGVDHVLPVWSGWTVQSLFPDSETIQSFDPYNKSAFMIYDIPFACTPGHVYFPIVRLRLHDGPGAWGPLAGAGQFTC
jgi:hypothetical protein